MEVQLSEEESSVPRLDLSHLSTCPVTLHVTACCRTLASSSVEWVVLSLSRAQHGEGCLGDHFLGCQAAAVSSRGGDMTGSSRYEASLHTCPADPRKADAESWLPLARLRMPGWAWEIRQGGLPESSLCFQFHWVSVTWGSVTQTCGIPQSMVGPYSGGAALQLGPGSP